MAPYLEKDEVCLWNWLSKGLQFVSYCEMVEEGLSETEGKLSNEIWTAIAYNVQSSEAAGR